MDPSSSILALLLLSMSSQTPLSSCSSWMCPPACPIPVHIHLSVCALFHPSPVHGPVIAQPPSSHPAPHLKHLHPPLPGGFIHHSSIPAHTQLSRFSHTHSQSFPRGSVHLSSIPAHAHLSISSQTSPSWWIPPPSWWIHPSISHPSSHPPFCLLSNPSNHPSLPGGFIHYSTVATQAHPFIFSQTSPAVLSLWIHPSFIHPNSHPSLHLLSNSSILPSLPCGYNHHSTISISPPPLRLLHPSLPLWMGPALIHPSTRLSLHLLTSPAIPSLWIHPSFVHPSSHPPLHLPSHPCIHPSPCGSIHLWSIPAHAHFHLHSHPPTIAPFFAPLTHSLPH